MKYWITALVAIVAVACGFTLTHGPTPLVLEAQTVPYTLVVAWDAAPDAVTYTCSLDTVVQVAGVAGLTCSFPVATLGAHTVSVTAVNPAFVPNESAPASLAFTLKQPGKPGNVKVK